MASETSRQKNPLRHAAAVLALLAIAAVWLYRAPYKASGLDVPPDTVEYALAPLQLLETGHYEIMLEGRPLPPRYPPWFSVIVIAPAYVLLGHDPGNAILPITATGVLGIFFAWAIGRRITHSSLGGIFAGLALLAVPTYSLWASQVMSDVPSIAVMLGACLLYLHVLKRPPSAWRALLAGLLVAIAVLFRPVFAAMALPFVLAFWRQRKTFLRQTAIFLIPLVSAAIVTALYNRATFGSPWRNGYHFWTPVPSDYPNLTFSLDYVQTNLWVLIHTAFPIFFAIALLAWIIARMTPRKNALAASRQNLLQLVFFFVLTAGPIVAFHLLYFFPTDRFHLPLLAGTAVIAGCLVALLFEERWLSLLKLVVPTLLLMAIAYRVTTPEPSPARRVAADEIRQHTPVNAIVISAIDPVYLERMAASGSSRQIVPLSRRVEYASKLLAPRRIDHPDPPPANWHDHRAIGLVRGGAEEAVRFVASEHVENLAARALAGTPIFLDASFLDRSDVGVLAQLKARFEFVPYRPNLFELRPR
jgi:4-amino-4-deoxy-L-arabinose transferase-like glycosyltransferase